MPVVAHEAVRPEPHPKPSLAFSEQLKEKRIIIVLLKEHLSMVASVQHMKATPLLVAPTRARHASFLSNSPSPTSLNRTCPRFLTCPFFRSPRLKEVLQISAARYSDPRACRILRPVNACGFAHDPPPALVASLFCR